MSWAGVRGGVTCVRRRNQTRAPNRAGRMVQTCQPSGTRAESASHEVRERHDLITRGERYSDLPSDVVAASVQHFISSEQGGSDDAKCLWLAMLTRTSPTEARTTAPTNETAADKAILARRRRRFSGEGSIAPSRVGCASSRSAALQRPSFALTPTTMFSRRCAPGGSRSRRASRARLAVRGVVEPAPSCNSALRLRIPSTKP